jgi:Tfp pilus tip-associated adhesin PilY1
LERNVSGTTTQRTITPKSPDTTATSPYAAGKRGWVFNFISSGERLVVAPQLALGTLVFPSTAPSGIICTAGGDTWLYYVDVETGLTSTSTSATTPKVEYLGNTLSSRASFISLTAGKVQALFRTGDSVTPPGATVVSSTTAVPPTPATPTTPATAGSPGSKILNNGKITTINITNSDGSNVSSTSVTEVPPQTGASTISRRSWREVPR